MPTHTTANITLSRPSGDRLYFLDNIRFFGIVFVVTIHLFSYLRNDLLGLGSYIKYLSFYAVPIFFICDGYLFAQGKNKQASSSDAQATFYYSRYFTKNITRLFIPWLSFTFLYFMFRLLAEHFNLVSDKVIIGKSISRALIDAYGSVHSGQLYFLLSLLIIRTISPFVLHKCSLLSTSIAFFVATLTYNFFSPELHRFLYIAGGNEPFIHAIWGAQFYFLGALVFSAIEIFSSKIYWVVSLIVSVLIVYILYVPAVFAIASLLCLFFTSYYFMNVKIPFVSYFGKRTMGIYLIHMPIVVNIVAIALSKVTIPPVFILGIGISICILVSDLLYAAATQWRIGKFIFGEATQR